MARIAGINIPVQKQPSSIQETVLQFAQQRSSVYNIARTYGLKVPGQRPSVAMVDFSITVPAYGDKEDLRYCGILRRGSQVNGAGQNFETVYDIDFSSAYNNDGYPNRLKIPNYDSNGVLVNYTITKRETVVNGTTKVFKRAITSSDVRPFYELFLPEKNVLGITSVLLKPGTQYSTIPNPQEFLTLGPERWYEVDALVQDRVFVEDPTKTSDQPGIKVGTYITTSNKFISEYTSQGFCKMTFDPSLLDARDAAFLEPRIIFDSAIHLIEDKGDYKKIHYKKEDVKNLFYKHYPNKDFKILEKIVIFINIHLNSYDINLFYPKI